MMQLTEFQRTTLLTPDVRFIMHVVAAQGGEARLVGGAVRDVVMGRPIGDCDFAVNLLPDQVMSIFTAQNVKVVPTGLAHGTVTVVVNGCGYEVTTLRRDVATDGRHAEVAYTTDWHEDAARRDFTINALYVDADGELTDYWGGLADCTAGIVRFIGNAEVRIREDVLRILRFYRFYAWFGCAAPDEVGQTACAALAPLIPELSVERVWREFSKLLAAPDPLRACLAMQASGVLPYLLSDGVSDVTMLTTLIDLEQKFSVKPSVLRRLLSMTSLEALPDLAVRLRFSNREKNNLAVLVAAYQQLMSGQDVVFSGVAYFCGVDAARDAALLAASHVAGGDDAVAMRLHYCAGWNNPKFPLTGKDLQAIGVESGVVMGRLLKQTELWWISQGFAPDRTACLDEVRRALT